VTPIRPADASADEHLARAARLLGSPTAMERISGALALGTLGDQDPSARLACAGLLCAYLRAVPEGWDAEGLTMPRTESDVRDEITAVIARRLRSGTGDQWLPAHFDFARAVFGSNADLSRCELAATCTFDGTVFTGTATFDRAHFSATDGAPQGWGGPTAPDPATAQSVAPAPHPAEREAVRHSFTDATFVGLASFVAATFDGTATFVGASIRDQADFSYATVSRDLVFAHAVIGGLDVTCLVVGGDLNLGFAEVAGVYAGRLTVNGELSLADARVELACFLPESRIGTLCVDRATFADLLDLGRSRIGAWSAEDATFHGSVDCAGTGFTAEAFGSQ